MKTPVSAGNGKATRSVPLCAVFLGAVLTACAVTAPVAVPAARAAGTLNFSSYPEPAYALKLIDDKWLADPEYQPYTAGGDMIPEYEVAYGDVNQDGIPEIFARHSQDNLPFCDPLPQFDCRLVIYANTPNGLVEIGRMQSSRYVTLLDHLTNGVRDLAVEENENANTARYIWNGTKYERQ